MAEQRTATRSTSSLIGIVGTLLLLGYLIRRFNWGTLLGALSGARVGPLMLAVAVLCFSHLLGVTDRWRRILRLVGVSVSFREAWIMRMGGAPLKFFSPLRVGEFLRLPYLRRQHDLSTDRALGAMAFEKFTFLTALLPALLARALVDRELASLAIVLAAVIGEAVAVAPWGQQLVQRAATLFGTRAREWSGGLLAAFACAGGRGLLCQTLYAVGIMAAEAVVLALCLRAVGVDIEFARWWTMLPGVLLAGLVPVTFAGLGAREVTLVVLFPRENPEALVAGGILFFILARLAIAVAGLPWMSEYLQRMVESKAKT